MNRAHPGRRFTLGAYKFVRIFVRMLAVLGVLLLLVFFVLRTAGVPAPILREALRRINAAGVPVAVDKVTLTLRGWRADHVRYYSKNPDDLAPVLIAGQVYFQERRPVWDAADSKGWGVHLIAADVAINPPLAWGVEIPAGSPVRAVERMEVSLDFMPDRIQVADGDFLWLGSRFRLNGTFLRGERGPGATVPSAGGGAAAPPERKIIFSAEQFRDLENRFKRLSLPEGAVVDVDFRIDAGDLAASQVEVLAHAANPGIRGVGFSDVQISAAFAWPVLLVQHAEFEKDLQALRLSGDYDFSSGLVEGELFNSITSTELLLLFPESIHGVPSQLGLRIETLPRLEIGFGPAPPARLADHLSGSFSIRGLVYRGLEFETLRGQMRLSEQRVDLESLSGILRGQEQRAAQTGSSMRGGSLEGSAFFDRKTCRFGVSAQTGFDPNLLEEPLEYAGNAVPTIQRFKFQNAPPRLHLELGANWQDWSGFFINVGGVATDVLYEGVMCDSLNAETFYTNYTLRIDPLLGTKNGRYLKGRLELDYSTSVARFDADCTMDPADIEQMISPSLDFFGNHLDVAGGAVQIQAHGIFDWDGMEATDIKAWLAAERFRMPYAQTDSFEARIRCIGPVLSVSEVRFGLCGGTGTGDFSVDLNPLSAGKPYGLGFQVEGVDIQEYRASIFPGKENTASGKLDGRLRVDADFSTNFFASATGEGSVRVDDGQLADLPPFGGFSRLMRKLIPGFDIFSITRLKGTFSIADGKVTSSDAYFGGNIISADGRGSYDPDRGYDAYIQVQILSETVADKVMRFLTYPVTKFLEVRLEGPMDNPSWRLKRFPREISNIFSGGAKTNKE